MKTFVGFLLNLWWIYCIESFSNRVFFMSVSQLNRGKKYFGHHLVTKPDYENNQPFDASEDQLYCQCWKMYLQSNKNTFFYNYFISLPFWKIRARFYSNWYFDTNQNGKCPIMPVKEIENKERSTCDLRFDYLLNGVHHFFFKCYLFIFL